MSKINKLSKSQKEKITKILTAFCRGFGCEEEVGKRLVKNSFIGEFASKEVFTTWFLRNNESAWVIEDKEVFRQAVNELFNRFYLFIDGYVFFDHWSR